MRITNILLGLCFLLVSVAGGQQPKQLILTGKVVDHNSQPVGGAEVIAYEELYDYSSGMDYTKLLNQIQETNTDGSFLLKVNIYSQYDVFIVGGGVAGSIAAKYAAMGGLKTLIIEMYKTPREKSCSGIQFGYFERIIGEKIPPEALCTNKINRVKNPQGSEK